MAIGSRQDLWRMFALVMQPDPSPFLTEAEAHELEAMGGQVLRIPVARRENASQTDTEKDDS